MYPALDAPGSNAAGARRDAPGTVTVSVDFELAWGMRDDLAAAATTLSPRRRAETAALDRLLDSCDRAGVPLTFATVGHLLLDACDGRHDGVHTPEGRRVDPGTGVDAHPAFYAPDLVARIRRANVDHEIATHTFSHVIPDAVPERVVDRELAAAATTHERAGLPAPRSLVAPRNRVPDRALLRDHDLAAVRVPRPAPPDATRRKYALRLRHWAVAPPRAVIEPRVRDGVVETYAAPYPTLSAVHLPAGRREPLPAFRAIPLEARQRRHEQFLLRTLDAVADTGRHAHLWTHLYNLANRKQWPPVAAFLDRLGALREQGRVRVDTMGALGDRLLARDAA